VYQFAIKLAVLASLESKIDELFGEEGQNSAKIHKLNAANARVFAMSVWESLDRSGRAGQAKVWPHKIPKS
jgi:hypothetical protein